VPSAKRASRRQRRSYLVTALLAFTVALLAMTGLAAPASLCAQEVDLEPASRAYAELRLDDAWAEIERVFATLEVGGADPVSRETRARAYVLGASIARARGDLTASDAVLDRALALDASLTLDPALHPPPLLEALERRRAALAARLEASPSDREVDDEASPPEPALVLTSPDPIVGPTGHDGGDPWPWIGLGIGGAVLLGGVIALTVVLAQPPASFELRGTIVP
jgi:hypothetical protein